MSNHTQEQAFCVVFEKLAEESGFDRGAAMGGLLGPIGAAVGAREDRKGDAVAGSLIGGMGGGVLGAGAGYGAGTLYDHLRGGPGERSAQVGSAEAAVRRALQEEQDTVREAYRRSGARSFEPRSFEPRSFEPRSFKPKSFEPGRRIKEEFEEIDRLIDERHAATGRRKAKQRALGEVADAGFVQRLRRRGIPAVAGMVGLGALGSYQLAGRRGVDKSDEEG